MSLSKEGPAQWLNKDTFKARCKPAVKRAIAKSPRVVGNKGVRLEETADERLAKAKPRRNPFEELSKRPLRC
jgi:hypothetical protein